MTSLRSKYYSTLGTVLAAAVADNATTTIAYPSGTTVGDFDKGLADSTDTYLILNKNDRWTEADPGFSISYGASEITITNLSGYSWAIGTEIDLHIAVKEGNRRMVSIPLPPMAEWTAADIITEIQPGIAGTLEYAELVVTTAVTTAAKAATLNLEIDTTNVTSMTLAVTSANATPKGVALAFGLPTAENTLTRASKLSREAASVTAFVEGNAFLNLYIRPTADDQY